MESKKNYQKSLLKTIDNIKSSTKKPTLLLHVCCGPCSTIPLELLNQYFDITIIYNNSNIYPKNEYVRRLDELKRYNCETGYNFKIIEFEYDNITYEKDLLEYKDLPEGSLRCQICFRKRLTQGFEYASKNGFEYFTTVMSISRFKNSQHLNEIGNELASHYGNVEWLEADFKKNGGYEKSLNIIKSHNMYFQNYCGCSFSKINREKHIKEKAIS